MRRDQNRNGPSVSVRRSVLEVVEHFVEAVAELALARGIEFDAKSRDFEIFGIDTLDLLKEGAHEHGPDARNRRSPGQPRSPVRDLERPLRPVRAGSCVRKPVSIRVRT